MRPELSPLQRASVPAGTPGRPPLTLPPELPSEPSAAELWTRAAREFERCAARAMEASDGRH